MLRLEKFGSSLAVQWLGLGAFTARARDQSLIMELRSRKLSCTAKKEDKFIDKESTIEVTRGWEECGGKRNYCLMGTEFLSEMIKVLNMDGCTTL